MKKPKKIRNAFVIAAKKKKSGKIKKGGKRKNGKNKQAELLKEVDE
jgi:hypothetical protein